MFFSALLQANLYYMKEFLYAQKFEIEHTNIPNFKPLLMIDLLYQALGPNFIFYCVLKLFVEPFYTV